MKVSEYDAFGPWIYEIDEKHDMPALFAEKFDKNEQHKLLIKIPVNKERRDLTPEMQMYDYVLGAYDDYLYVMKRDELEISTFEIAYKDVVAIKNATALLKGNLSIFTKDGAFEMEYNTCSEEMANRLIKIVRNSWPQSRVEMTNALPSEDVSFHYNNILSQLKKQEEQMQFVTYQKRHKIYSAKQDFLNKMHDVVLRPRIQEAIAFVTPCNAILVHSGSGINHLNRADYSLSHCYILLSAITKVAHTKHKRYKEVQKVEILTDKHKFSILLDLDNAENIKSSLNI